ncbi:MAG: hypothetical protein RLZZ210_1376 [Pseudomonadota bacterium]|jgi:hypothetical protein
MIKSGIAYDKSTQVLLNKIFSAFGLTAEATIEKAKKEEYRALSKAQQEIFIDVKFTAEDEKEYILFRTTQLQTEFSDLLRNRKLTMKDEKRILGELSELQDRLHDL